MKSIALPSANIAQQGRNSDISHLLARADAGDTAAQNLVGIHYLHGIGVRRDYPTAAKWFRRSAAGRNRDAQANLGLLYMRGLGVSQDYASAAEWLLKAASAGKL